MITLHIQQVRQSRNTKLYHERKSHIKIISAEKVSQSQDGIVDGSVVPSLLLRQQCESHHSFETALCLVQGAFTVAYELVMEDGSSRNFCVGSIGKQLSKSSNSSSEGPVHKMV